MIKRLVNHIVALTVLLTVTSSLAAAEPGKKLMTAAILSESGLQKYGSLLTASLSPSQELALVERDRIDVIMAEGVNLINSADRRALGERLKADHLILLSGSKEAMQVTLCECVSGARIGRFTVSPEAVDMTTVAAKVLASLKRFSGGVKQIIAISTFYSLDLQHDYRQLELDLANALRDDLMKKKGIAVVEIDEAAEIANELDLTGGDVKKTAMTFVFGEYETVRQKTGDPLVQASITVVQNQAVAMHSTLDPLTINDAKKALQSALKKALTAKPSQTTADARIQFNHFVRQADRFAKIGELDRAIAFREAALLVAPPNSDRKDPQHLRLAFEYIRSFDRPYSGSGLTSESSREEELAYRGRAVRRMQRSLRHTEYIIRNQICSPVDAYQLIYHNARRMSPNYHSGYDRKTIGRNHLDVIDTLLPLLFKHRALGVPEIRKKIVAGSVAGNIYDLCAVGKGDEETQFVLKLLLQIVPEDMPVSSTIVYRMGDIGHRKYDTPEIQQDVDAFIMKLANSERPLPALYGKYALVKKRYLGDREVSEDLLKAAKHLEELVNTKAIAELDADGHFFRSQISETVTRIRHALKKKAEKAKPPKKITHSERKPPPQSQKWHLQQNPGSPGRFPFPTVPCFASG